jgi:hypothetical protein
MKFGRYPKSLVPHSRSVGHVAALHCIIFFARMSGLGQKETKKHVRCHGSFRRKQPWQSPACGRDRAGGGAGAGCPVDEQLIRPVGAPPNVL